MMLELANMSGTWNLRPHVNQPFDSSPRLFLFYVYLHVGCTLYNQECHLVFCLSYLNLKLMHGCKLFLKKP